MIEQSFTIPTWVLMKQDFSNDSRMLYIWLRYLYQDGGTRKYSTQRIADETGFKKEQIKEIMPNLVYNKVLKASCVLDTWSFSIPEELR